MVEIGLGVPMAVGEEDVGLLAVLPQLQVGAAAEASYCLFALLKECNKGVYGIVAEGHLYYADDHSKVILRSLCLPPRRRPKRLAALPRLIHISR